MWTRKDLCDFKESIKREGGESVIKVIISPNYPKLIIS